MYMRTIGQFKPPNVFAMEIFRCYYAFMQLKTTNKEVVEEVPYGMYVWKCADGEYAGDSDGNIMNVFCLKSNYAARNALIQAAKHYGVYDGGSIEWWPGRRRITDEELAEQEMRAASGMVADPYDLPSLIDADRARREHGRT